MVEFGEQAHAGPHVLALGEESPGTQPGQAVELGLGCGDLLPEPLDHCDGGLPEPDGLGVELGPGESEQLLGDEEARDNLSELRLDLALGEVGLVADDLPHPSAAATVVDVAATVAIPVLLARHRPATPPAPDEADEGKLMADGAGGIMAAEEILNAVELALRYNGLVDPGVEFTAVLDEASVEGVPEDRVEAPHVEQARGVSAASLGSQAQGLTGVGVYLGDGVGTREVPLEDFLHEREPNRVDDGLASSSTTVAVGRKILQVADGHHAGHPTRRKNRTIATPNIVRKIVHIFLRHAEFEIQKELVVRTVSCGTTRRYNLTKNLTIQGIDQPATVHHVARETIRFPAENASDLLSFNLLHHLGKHGASCSSSRL